MICWHVIKTLSTVFITIHKYLNLEFYLVFVGYNFAGCSIKVTNNA